MDDWKSFALRDALILNPAERLPAGIEAPFIDMANVLPWNRWHGVPIPRKVSSGSRFRDGDTLVARITPCLENGKTAQVRNLGNGVIGWGSTEFIVLRARHGITDENFVYHVAREPEFREYAIKQMTGSSGRQRVQIDALSDFIVNLPPLNEQRAIAGVLGALDDKIESNRRITVTIEKLIPLIFQSMTSESELKLLPEVAKLQKGISYRSIDLEDSETAMVTLKSYDRNGGYKSNGLKPYIGKYKPEQVLLSGEMAVAQTDLTQGAEVVGRVIRIPRQDSFETLVASLDLVIVRPLDAADETYLYGALLQEDFREHCRSRTSGTTVLHLGSDALPKYLIPWADSEVRSAFADEVQPLLEEHDSLTKESSTLERLRDVLLPELLSGRLRVKDSESFMECV